MSEKRTTKPKRPKVPDKTFNLVSEDVIPPIGRYLHQMPIDPDNPIEVVIREPKKKRKLSMNDAMWAGPLRDIEREGWYQGHQYRAEVWHEHFKEMFLPDENDPEFDPSHVLEGYQKWGTNPWTGARVLVGSTTQLTDPGMRLYLLQMEAEAATEHGVTFRPRVENIEPQGRVA